MCLDKFAQHIIGRSCNGNLKGKGMQTIQGFNDAQFCGFVESVFPFLPSTLDLLIS